MSGSKIVTSAYWPGAEQAAVEQADLGGVQRRHLTHGVFQA